MKTLKIICLCMIWLINAAQVDIKSQTRTESAPKLEIYADTNIINSPVLGIILNVPHYQQCNQSWSLNQLGNCPGLTICTDGCAVTCEAMLLKANNVNINPGQLNTYLKNNGGYNQNCEIYWDVGADYPGSTMTFTGSPAYSLARIKSEIDEGDPVILNTRVSNINHFVVVKGYNNNGSTISDFIVLDPLRTTESNLSNYSPLLGLRTFDSVTTILTSGYAKVYDGITIIPNPVVRTQSVNVRVTLKEVNGFPITIDTITCAILFNGVFKFDFPRKTNVSIGANGTYLYNEFSNSFGSGTALAMHTAVFRGYKNGWFDFTVLPTGHNPITFNVVAPNGIQKINETIPNEYKLYSNYPNPFNPSTNIRFTLPENIFVNLSVMDITGKEVAVLINKYLLKGNYQFNFNTINLASGVYFYKFETVNFNDTKRMILTR